MANAKFGKAIVIGGGVAGLATCGALAEHFAEVVLLERDELSDDLAVRPHVPQGYHVHTLLAGGERALSELFPGFVDSLLASGAVPVRGGLEMLVEQPPIPTLPRRDLGLTLYNMTRPCLERVLVQKVRALANVRVVTRARVERLLWDDANQCVCGVELPDGGREQADLVIDAGGRAKLSLELMRTLDIPLPAEEVVGVDIAYATGVFELAPTRSHEWKGFITQADPSAPKPAGAVFTPIEGGLYVLSVAGRNGNDPPGDPDAFMAFVASSLATRTIMRQLEGAKLVSPIWRFRFPESRWQHFERLPSFPERSVVLGDGFCRFNPINAQGMSVAAQSALCLRNLLRERDSLLGIAQQFYPQIAELTEAPWGMSTFNDFLFPDTVGERPAAFYAFRRTRMAFTQLAMEDAGFQELQFRVLNLVEPRWSLRSAVLCDRRLRKRVFELVRAQDAQAAE